MSSTHRISPQEVYYLDQLIGRALFDAAVCQRLLCGEAGLMLDGYPVSVETRAWLATIRVPSLEAFAAVIVEHSTK